MTLEEEILREVLEQNKIPKETIEIVALKLKDAFSELHLFKDCPPIEQVKESSKLTGEDFKRYFVDWFSCVFNRVHGPNYNLKDLLTYRYGLGWIWEEMEFIVKRLD